MSIEPHMTRTGWPGAFVLGLLVLPVSAHAQWSGSSGVTLAETYSDNVARQSPALAKENWATEVSPWLAYGGRSSRAYANLEMRAQNWINSNSANRNVLRGAANGKFEAVENTLFLEGGVSKDRQQVSQFAPADAAYAAPANSTEVVRSWVSPRARWRFGASTEVSAQYRFENVDADRSEFSGQSNTATLDLMNGSAFGRLGWGLSGRHTDTSAQLATQAASSNSYSGSLYYALSPELKASVFGGEEFNDYAGGVSRRTWNRGAGLKWQPDERTAVSAQSSKRFFGRGFAYSVSQRWQQSVFNWGYSKDATNSSNSGAAGNGGDPNWKITYAAQYQDALAKAPASFSPAEKEAYAALALLLQGLPIPTVTSGFSSQNHIERRMSLSWVVTGLRNSVSLSAYSSDRESYTQSGGPTVVASSITILSDDLVRFSRVKQRGWSADWRHDLSSNSTLGLRYTYTDTSGYGPTGLRTTTHTDTWGLAFNRKIGAHTSGALNFSQSRSRWSATDYRENAVGVSLNHRF